jgi:hypothetical protein
MMDQLGHPKFYEYSKETINRLWNSNSCLAFGGLTSITTGATEEYDGTTWATSNPLNTARQVLEVQALKQQV